MAYGACDPADTATAKRISYWIGPNGRIRKAYSAVAAAEHPGQALEDLKGQAA